MLAVALARAAVEAGHRVYFTTAADLAARCHKAALEGRWGTCMRFYAGPRPTRHRRARVSAATGRRRRRAVPGHQPALPEVLDDPDHQRRHRRLGWSLRRRHRRRGHAGPAAAPRRRGRHRRALLPAARPPELRPDPAAGGGPPCLLTPPAPPQPEPTSASARSARPRSRPHHASHTSATAPPVAGRPPGGAASGLDQPPLRPTAPNSNRHRWPSKAARTAADPSP
jgi:hypothetical protein